MSWTEIPKEIKEFFVDFAVPLNLPKAGITTKEIIACGRQVVQLSLACREMREACSERLAAFKKTNDLMNKYGAYKEDYERPYHHWVTCKEVDRRGNPQLLDALVSGSNWAPRSTFNEFTQDIENDIKEIITTMPLSINCILGSISRSVEFPPLFAACINPKMPIYMIEFLIQQGANPKATLQEKSVAGYIGYSRSVSILDHIRVYKLDDERLQAIRELFKKYGAD